MKNMIFLSIASLSLLTAKPIPAKSYVHRLLVTDTGIVSHIEDGLANEWPADRFTLDKETGIQFALDNDKENLYIALKIESQFEQIKMMSMGMRTFFDMKAKHKENLGVEYPLKKEYSMPTRPTSNQANEQQPKPDVKQVRMRFGQSLLAIKLFGFSNEDPVEQSLEVENSLQISFSWDSTDVMFIEYLVPLQMLESKTESLNNKQISVGWKVNGVDIATSTSTSVVSRPAGSRPGTTSGSAQNRNTGGGDKMMKEQEIWAKYTIY